MASPALPGPRAGMPLVLLLAATQLLAFSDRFLLTLLATPIKQALSLSDTQLGLLQGSAFALPYALALPLLGALADRGRRRGVLVGSLVAWSAATLACAFTGSFEGLLACRLGLGLGQAGVAPAALSLLALRLAPGQLGRGVAALTAGATLGRSLALLAGGGALGWLTARGGLSLPGLGAFAPWQALFVLSVTPNLVVLIPLLRLRGAAGPAARPARTPPRQGHALAWVVRRWRAYLPHTAAATASVLMTQTLTAWAPSHFVRAFGMSPAGSGLALGLIVLVAAPLGHLAGGTALDRLRWAGRRAAAPVLLGFSLILALPATALMSLAPTSGAALTGFAALVLLLGTAGPPGLAGLQFLTPRPLRGRVSALFLAVTTLAGIGTGPLLVGLLSDAVFGAAGIGHALLAVFAVTGALGVTAACYARLGWRPRRRRAGG